MNLTSFYSLRVSTVMDNRTWDLPLIEENASIKIAFILLIGRGYGWVIRGQGSMELMGVITEHDMLSLFSSGNDNKNIIKTVANLMTSNPVTCQKDENIGEILERIQESGIRRLPVVKQKKLIGEITLRHLMEKYYSMFLFRR
jgi:CBS domain-containing protein